MLFYQTTLRIDYPSIDYLVDWAGRMNFHWRIEHDIFHLQKNINFEASGSTVQKHQAVTSVSCYKNVLKKLIHVAN